MEVEKTPRSTLFGEPAVRVDVQVPQDVPALRQKLAANGISPNVGNAFLSSFSVFFRVRRVTAWSAVIRVP
jgi:hypothetical protein